MSQAKNNTRNKVALLTIILAGEAIFFLPFVLARIFRPTLLNVFEITNLELGVAFSVYGIVAMASYFFGVSLREGLKMFSSMKQPRLIKCELNPILRRARWISRVFDR